MLGHIPIFIVEDEPLLAMMLADEVERLEGIVVGTPATVAEALALLEQNAVAAAIMDANLADATITAVALKLLAADVPFVLYTGTGLPDELAHRSAEITVVMKPGHPTEKLVELLDRRRR